MMADKYETVYDDSRAALAAELTTELSLIEANKESTDKLLGTFVGILADHGITSDEILKKLLIMSGAMYKNGYNDGADMVINKMKENNDDQERVHRRTRDR